MKESSKARVKFALPVAAALVANYGIDRVTKLLAVQNLQPGDTHSYFGGLMLIRYAENTGAFLSLGDSWPGALKIVLLLALPTLICLFGVYHVLFRETSMAKAIAMASVVAGGLANLQDRMFNDFTVIDFLNFGIGKVRTGILNFADLSVTFGVIVWMILEWRSQKREKAAGGK